MQQKKNNRYIQIEKQVLTATPVTNNITVPWNNYCHFLRFGTNRMVPSDWDLALNCICGPKFISYLMG